MGIGEQFEFEKTGNIYPEQETNRPADAQTISFKCCERCAEITLHSFVSGVGECLKCEEKKGWNDEKDT